MINRRRFVQGVGMAALGLVAGCSRLPWQAQAPAPAVKVHRLGFLVGSDPAAQARALDNFRQALAELGYVEGQNLAIEYRWGEGSAAPLAESAADLARLPVEVIVVASIVFARIAREATTTVPIVLAGTGDLVAEGLAASYARPGGNVTGVTNISGELGAKRLELLREVAPSISRVAIFWDAASFGPFPAEAWGRDAQAAGVQLQPLEPRGPEEIEGVLEGGARAGADALLVAPGPLGRAHMEWIVQRAARLRWPAMYYRREFVDLGGLMTYEASLADTWRRAAAVVDRILKGARPEDIPIERPRGFDFVINLNTAQALGLTIPPHVLLQATEVIQ